MDSSAVAPLRLSKLFTDDCPAKIIDIVSSSPAPVAVAPCTCGQADISVQNAVQEFTERARSFIKIARFAAKGMAAWEEILPEIHWKLLLLS